MSDKQSRSDRKVARFQRASSDSSRFGDNSGQMKKYFAGFEAIRPQDPVARARQQQLQAELRRQYSDLIEKCQNFRERDGIEQNLESVMKQNIQEGKRLFSQIEGGPGDMYMAFLHTKMCSGMILSKTEKIGSSSSGFTVEGLLNAIVEKSHNSMGEFSPEQAVSVVCKEAQGMHKTLPTLTVLLGSFDRASILTPPEAKEKKPRATPRKKLESDEGNATHSEEVRLTEAERERQAKDSPEQQSKEILRILTTNHKAKKTPENLFEFTMNKESVATFFENLFYVSFLVRDGFVSIKRRMRKDRAKYDSDLLISPEEPPKKQHGHEHDPNARKQYIVSFNASVFKALSSSSQGPPSIKRGRHKAGSSKRK